MSSQSSLSDLLEQCQGAFVKEFGTKPTIAAQAPGRVNIIGEHTDYNNGFVFPMAIPLYTVIVGKPNNSDEITIVTLSADVGEQTKAKFQVPNDKNTLEPGSPKWANYMKGVIQHFPHKLQGFDCCVVSTVPLGGGLSSSASLEVATATFLEALTGQSLKLEEKALLCQKAEHTFAGMPCGIMDQFISCMGKENCALLIDCQSLETRLVPLTKPETKSKSDNPEIAFLVVNSNVKHELSGSEYPQRRDDCFEAAKVLGVKSLRDANINSLRENREKMNDRVYQRALHVVGEIERCTSAADAISNEDYDTLGRLMYQSHVSLRDLYAVSCAELDQLVDITMQCGVYGSRMTGGGFGGCIVALVKADQIDRVIEEINKKYSKKATSYVFTAVNGTKEIKL